MFNLDSPKQVSARILADGYELPKTKKGNPTSSKKVLKRIKEPNEFITDKLAHSDVKTLVNTFGRSFLDDVEVDGRVWSSFNINRASTGRYSSSNPNLENIPKSKEYRACFIAGIGNVIIVLDYSSQEPRILAHFSQDPLLLEIFRAKKDIYIESAKLMFNWSLTKKDSRRNDIMKPTVLGASYGLTGYGMEINYGIPKEEGQEYLDLFFSVFEGADTWIKNQKKKKEYVKTVYGRKFHLNPYLSAGKSDRNSINSQIQGSASDMIKIAMYRTPDYYDWSKKLIVNTIHDEVVLEVPEKEGKEVFKNAKRIMIEVGEETHPGIPSDQSQN